MVVAAVATVAMSQPGCPSGGRSRGGGGGGGAPQPDGGRAPDAATTPDAADAAGAADATPTGDLARPDDLGSPRDVALERDSATPLDQGAAPDLQPDLEPDLGPQRHPLELGRPETFELGTWNLRNFPSSNGAEDLLVELLLQMDVDLFAVQEVADVAAFDRVVDRLPAHGGAWSLDTYGDGSYQKTGLIFRVDQLRLRQTRRILDEDGWAFPRPPMQGEFELRRPGRPPVDLVAIVVHLKAQAGETNEERRRSACDQLAAHVEALRRVRPDLAVVLLGDFNDSVWDPPPDNVFRAFLQAPERYLFLSAQPTVLSAWGRRFGPLIDHVAITEPLFADWEGGTTWIVDVESWRVDYPDVLSDHEPVVAVFP